MASGAPGVHIDEIQSAPAIAVVPTSVAAFVGWAAEGPENAPGLVASFAQFQQLYGGLSPGSLMSYAVMQFFENGGGQAYIVRLTPGSGGEGPPGGTVFHEALNADGSQVGANGAPIGVRLLDLVPRFNLLCVPGETDPVTLGDLQGYVRARRAFLIVDCQRTDSVAALSSPAFRSSALFGADAINAAFYFPWVEAPDPLNANQPTAYPPCGFVAGVYAATDAARGVWKAPAGPDTGLADASGLAVALTDVDNATLNAGAVNCLRTLAQFGTVVWGARTLAGSDFGRIRMEVRSRPPPRALRRGEPLSGPQVDGIRAERPGRSGRGFAPASAPSCSRCTFRAPSRARRPARPISSNAASTP